MHEKRVTGYAATEGRKKRLWMRVRSRNRWEVVALKEFGDGRWTENLQKSRWCLKKGNMCDDGENVRHQMRQWRYEWQERGAKPQSSECVIDVSTESSQNPTNIQPHKNAKI